MLTKLNSYLDFWQLPITEQKDMLGEYVTFGNNSFTVIELDPVSRSYTEIYSLLHLSVVDRSDKKRFTKLWIPTPDDVSTLFYWKASSWPTVWQFMQDYMHRTNYYISIAAIYASKNYMGDFVLNDSY